MAQHLPMLWKYFSHSGALFFGSPEKIFALGWSPSVLAWCPDQTTPRQSGGSWSHGRSPDSLAIPGFDGWTNPSEEYYIVKLGSFSQIFGLRIQNLWNHHLDTVDRRTATPWRFNSSPLKISPDPKGKDFPSNHHFSEAIFLNFGV